MTSSRPREVSVAPTGRPASANTTTLIVAAVVLVGAGIAAVVLGGRSEEKGNRPTPPATAPAAPGPAVAAAEALPDRSTGIAACDEMIGIIRCAQPLLPGEKQEDILKGGRMIVRAIGQVQRMGQQAPELTGKLETACREGTGQLRTALSGLPALAPCLRVPAP
jgi:hypothetical protein